MVEPPLEERFSINAVCLASLISDIVTRAFNAGFTNIPNPTITNMATTFIQCYDKRKLIENFILYSYNHWDSMHKKEQRYMEEHASDIFRDLPSGEVSAFKSLYHLKDPKGVPVMRADELEDIWDFFHSFVKMSIKYIHIKRCPTLSNGTFIYKFPFPIDASGKPIEIDIDRHAKIWNVDLHKVSIR